MKRLLMILGLCITVQAYAQHPMCSGSRKDIYSFSPGERLELRNLILDWLQTEINPAFPSGYERYPLVSQHSAHGGMIHGTGNKKFVEWHRYYIQELEHWLTDNGHNKYVPLPSWDPQTAIPDEFFNSAAGAAAGSAQLDAGFPDNTNQTISPPSISNYLPPGACTNYPTANGFSNSMEGAYHNPIHVFIGGPGGSMSSTTTAPGSAVFWIYHAWIDDLWYCYQRNCHGLGADLYIKKYDTDEGNTPVPAGTPLWITPDIWVRNNPDGFLNQVNEPVTMSGPSDKAYVYVKVKNKGQAPNRDEVVGDIKVYWAQASAGLSWPNPWTGGSTVTCGGVARPLGNLIGNKPLRRVNENFFNTVHHAGMPSTLERDYYIYEFEWSSLPDPDHYTSCLLPWEPEHFCILARIQEEGHTTPISTDLGSNLTSSNNVALRNITILRDGVQSMRPGGILWGNYTSTPMKNVKLLIKFETQADAQLLQHADVYLKLDNATVAHWAKVKGKSSSMTRNGSTFRLLADGGYIENFSLPSNTIKGASVVVQPKNGKQIANTYKFDLVQYEGSTVIGGERYIVEPAPKNGNKGMNTVNVASEEGQLSAVKSSGSFILYPNPANSSFTILSNTHANSKLDIDIYNSIGSKIRSYRSVVQGELISTGELSAGIYVVQIVDCETKEMSNQKLIIKK